MLDKSITLCLLTHLTVFTSSINTSIQLITDDRSIGVILLHYS